MKRLSDKIIQLLNFRIKAELESSYLYEAMANCLDFKGYVNGAKLWRKDADDERVHARWAINYMLAMDVKPDIPTIDAPKVQCWDNIQQLVDATVAHEDLVTQQCTELAKAAFTENDLKTFQFVNSKYISEQIEELEKVLERQKYVSLYDYTTGAGRAALEEYFEDKLE